MLSSAELREKLGLTPADLKRYIAEGLPRVGKGRRQRFDPAAVAEWLLASGYATRASPSSEKTGIVCTTRAEAARLCGVSLRTFATWCTDPTFPGRPGDPARQNGYFPIDDILAWRAARDGDRSTDGQESPRERLLRVRGDREELKLAQDRAGLIEIAEVERLLRRVIHTARAVLEAIPDELIDALPPGLTTKVKHDLRERMQRRLDDALASLAELLEGDTDPTHDDDDESTTK